MLNLKYKAYNTKKLRRLDDLRAISSQIWNHSLALQKRYYSLYGSYIHKYRLQKHIAKLRNKNNRWKLLGSQATQQIIDRLDLSYKAFFKKTAKRPPKFKSWRHYSSFTYKQAGYTLNGNVLTINGIGRFKFHKSRDYKNIKTITVKKDSVGSYYFILTCDMKPEPYERLRNGSIGMDFGLTTYLTLSDGKQIENPEFFKQGLKSIKEKSRELSRKKIGSSNRRRALKNLSRVHKSVDNKRTDFQWKLAHELCKHNELIAIEDLNLDAMKKLWGRKVSDLAYGEFVNKLEQVAQKYETTVVKVDRFFPSSKLCSCGYIHKGLTLADRIWACPSCNAVNERDLNASRNILTEGVRLCRTKCKTPLGAI